MLRCRDRLQPDGAVCLHSAAEFICVGCRTGNFSGRNINTQLLCSFDSRFSGAHSSSRGEGHVITIDVLRAFRRFGIGTSLLRAAEDRLRIRNCQAIRLETAVDNRTALSFYKRQGYYIHGTIPRYYPNSMDAFVLRKDLLSASQPATLRQ